VEVQREPLDRDPRRHRVDDLGHLSRMRDADGVADGHFGGPHCDEGRRQRRHPVGRDRPLERTAERGRQVGAHSHAGGDRANRDVAINLERLVDRPVEVPLAEGF